MIEAAVVDAIGSLVGVLRSLAGRAVAELRRQLAEADERYRTPPTPCGAGLKEAQRPGSTPASIECESVLAGAGADAETEEG